MFLLWIVALAALIGLVQAFDRVRRLERTTEELRRTVDRLTRLLDEGAAARSVAAAPARPPKPEPIPERPPIHTPVPAVVEVVPPRDEPAAPTHVPSPPRPRVAASQPAKPEKPFDWEALIGVRLFAVVASLALFLAGGFFVSYSMEHGWLTPQIQFAIGIVAGVTCLVLGELKGSRRYAWTADALDASGIALLYVVFFASFARWHLVGATAAFFLFALATVVAVLLAIRRASLLIALLGLLGGFASPAIVATGEDNPIGLFGYLLVLNAGLAWVAYRKRWPVLTALSLAFTTLYQWGWVSKFLTAGKLPLAVGIFLVFPMLGFAALALNRPEGEERRSTTTLFAHAARVGAALPLLFSIYLAAVPAYGARFGVLFSYLFLLDAGLFAVALFQGPRLLHLLGAASTLLVFGIWLRGSYDATAWPWVLVAVAVFTVFYLVTPFATTRRFVRHHGEELGDLTSRAVLAAPLLLFSFPVLAAIEQQTAHPTLLFTTLLALLGACASYGVVRRAGLVHFVAAFAAVAAEAVWSARYLAPERLLAALAIYGAFGLFFIGVPIIARRRGTPLTPQGAGAALALVSIALLFFLASGSVAQSALWGIALLLAILTSGLFAEASASRLPILAIAGTLLAWAVLAVWWMAATVAIALIPAVSIVGGYALLTIAGSLWAMRREEGSDASEARGLFRSGAFVGLVGHLFLLFVAAEPKLAIPPGPLLAVLGVLTAAAAVGALYVKGGELFLGAIVATTAVLIVWELTAQTSPWPLIAIVCAGVVVALALAWLPLARRTGGAVREFLPPAAAAGIGAQFVAMFAAGQHGVPSLGILLIAQLAFVAVTLSVATMDLPRLEWLTVAAVVPAALSGFWWMAMHDAPGMWSAQLALTTPIFLAFIAYPLVLGRRAGSARAPYIATVFASVFYFFQARTSIYAGGYGSLIGALPVVEAGLLALVLASLVRLERQGVPRTPEEVTRLALIAGAALGFVTLAIPLQLERNWITIGWALEGAALAWLYSRVPHKGLLLFTLGLFALVFVRLALNPEVLRYELRGEMRIWNWYLYTYLLCAAAMLVGGRVLLKTDDRFGSALPRLSSLLPSGAIILLFLLLNIEIADYFASGPTITFDFFSSALAQDLSYTLGWAVFAVGLLAAGIVTHSKPGRITAIVLLSIAMAKCAFHDLWRLGGLYRVGSLVGIAFCALLITVALQKFVLTSRPAPEPSEVLS